MRTVNHIPLWAILAEGSASDPDRPKEFTPGQMPERRALLLTCRGAIDEIHYLKVVGQRTSIDQRRMLTITAELLGPHFNLDMVKADVQKLLGASMASMGSAMFTYRHHAEGFDFCFALLQHSGTFVTGVIEVRHPKPAGRR